jgi:hypothetical protein
MKKQHDLVYFVIGGEPAYARVLEYCLNTLRGYPENDCYDTLVICDASYVQHVSSLPFTHVHVCADNADNVQASTRKLDVFEWPGLVEYERVLYLDCDIVVTGSLAPVFDSIKDLDSLYVANETLHHKERYFECLDTPYSAEDLASFDRSGILPFNAGQFAFAASTAMRNHFDAIRSRIAKGYDAALHFYEQSFMNDHFNRAGKVDAALNSHVVLFAQELSAPYPGRVIAHFCNVCISSADKLQSMRTYHARASPLSPPATWDSRALISSVIAPLSAEPVVAEIGTFHGDYAETLLMTLNPKALFLIDPWAGEVISGDQDGNNVCIYDGETLVAAVKTRFATHLEAGTVKMLRKLSYQVTDADIPPKSFDLLYIDGDHSYEGVKNDLKLGLKWVRAGGWICGHDYEMNMNKTVHVYDFGVKRAVDEFCCLHGYRVRALMCDGCVSFALKVS